MPKDMTDEEMEPEALAADVAELLAEQSEPSAPATEKDELDEIRSTGADVEGDSQENMRVTLTGDTTFDSDRRNDLFEKTYELPIGPDHVPVTLDDKAQFMLSTLDDTRLFLEITVAGTKTVTVRDLSPYEEDLVLDAMQYYVKAHNLVATALLPSYAQQFRLMMQITAIAGHDVDYLSFEYGKDGSREEQAKKLAEESMVRMGNMSGARYSLCLKAAMVFQHKMRVMCEHLLNKDFWDPASTN